MVFVSSFLSVVLEKLTSPPRFARKETVYLELKIWEEQLRIIDAKLSDAEEMQLCNESMSLRKWLEDVQDLAYDMDDILDEIATEALRHKLMTESQSSSNKVRKLVPASNPTPSIASKIKKTSKRLKELVELSFKLGLKDTTEVRSIPKYQRPASTSVPTEPAIYGRDEDKAKILDMVLSDEASHGNFGVISIVGEEGIGKTTLAREVYKHKSVLENFNLRGWFCFGDDYNVFRISKTILKSITPRSFNLENSDQVQHLLKESLAGRKFLFVLDDFWSENFIWRESFRRWEILCSAFTEGAPGSKIIITTCFQDVPLPVHRGLNWYPLNPLSDEDCWLTFAGQANASEYQHLEVIREKVVRKCRGWPLAARVLGGLLRFKERDGWEDILNSKICSLYYGQRVMWDESGIPSGIPSMLKLCYYHLPSHLKRCFAYCAFLPTDYEFKEKELVLLWMAEGLIQQSNDTRQLEELGGEYFHNLASRSIFQKSDGDDSMFVMHDLIHCMAQYVSGETSLRLEDAYINRRYLSKRVRYCSYSGVFYDDRNKLEVSSELKNLRTFLSVLMDGHTFCVADQYLSHLLSRFKKLRVLSLRNYDITMVPDSIGNVTSLRYLNFSGTNIRTLPESTNMLFNLQVLLLRDCFCLVRLPYNMGN